MMGAVCEHRDPGNSSSRGMSHRPPCKLTQHKSLFVNGSRYYPPFKSTGLLERAETHPD
jgi:hypothetical protein